MSRRSNFDLSKRPGPERKDAKEGINAQEAIVGCRRFKEGDVGADERQRKREIRAEGRGVL